MRFRFIRPGNMAQAITSHLPTLQPVLGELIPALRGDPAALGQGPCNRTGGARGATRPSSSKSTT